MYPSDFAPEDFAYHFVGEADVLSERNPELVKRVSGDVQAWIADWQTRKPILNVSRFPSGEYVVYDTRREGNPSVQVISRTMAALITNEATVASRKSNRRWLTSGWSTWMVSTSDWLSHRPTTLRNSGVLGMSEGSAGARDLGASASHREKDRPHDFSWLLDSISITDFFEQYYEKEILHIAGRGATYYEPIFSADAFESLVYQSADMVRANLTCIRTVRTSRASSLSERVAFHPGFPQSLCWLRCRPYLMTAILWW